MTDTNIWTIINDISGGKQYLFDDTTEKIYVPWIINKSFASHLDTITAVEFINRHTHLDKKLQHDYLFYTIPAKRKRWKPWLKKSDKEKKEEVLLTDIAVALGYNNRRMKEVWKMLSEEQRKELVNRYVKMDANNDNL